MHNDKKVNRLTADGVKVGVGLDGRSNQPQCFHKPKPKAEQGPNLFNSVRTERGEEAAQSMKLAGAGSQGQRKDAVSGASECKGEAATADVEAATSYPKEPAKITNVGGYTRQQVFSVDKASIGRRGHSGLS